jgi:ribosome-binding ATPase YchF (GTP1/OBG family)
VAEGQGAKVSAQPFTTIAPNIGRGFALVPDPVRACGLQPGCERCGTAYV